MRVALGRTELQVHPLCLGGNVFGWSANAAQSEEVLTAYETAGGTSLTPLTCIRAGIPAT